MSPPIFQRATMAHQTVGTAVILDTVQAPLNDGIDARVFFTTGTDAQDIIAGQETEISEVRSVGDAMIVSLTYTGPEAHLLVGGTLISIDPKPEETELFFGLNTVLAIRNGETVQATLDWLKYHVDGHGMQAALILDRAQPGQDMAYAQDLESAVTSIKGLQRVVYLRADVPLGQKDLPDEAHPYCAPDAPGKDRMDIPPPAPWDSPLGELQIFELLRRRFLDQARAVAILDISDLLMQREGKENLFDETVKSTTGAVVLVGRHCYPWRVRKKDTAGFADHICVQFDATKMRRRWCVAPAVAGDNAVWRLVRIVGTSPQPDEWERFFRFMGLRHPTDSVAKIVPKTSLIEDDALLDLSTLHFGHKPVRMPVLDPPEFDPNSNDVTIITTMKNEGPFILEWIAYHRAIGVKNFLVYTNDCTDGTDTLLDLLQEKGIVQHRDNPFKGTDLKPQHAALQSGESEAIIQNADWIVCMDVDEFINIKAGDGTLAALFDAVGDANMISMTWRLFGNSDIHEYIDEPLIGAYRQCALEMTRKPHQAWGFKTLFRNIGLFKKLGVHRPKGLNPQLWTQIKWVNGSGRPMPKDMYRNAWRSTSDTVGYDLVALNHYAVRSAESFLVKRDRGRVNHVDRDQGLAYWFRMNNNLDQDLSVQRMLPALKHEMDILLADQEIAEMHSFCAQQHRAKIDALKATENYAKFYQDLTGARMERLARMHQHFGANVFLAGPDVVPDEVVNADHPEDYFFTVEKQDTTH